MNTASNPQSKGATSQASWLHSRNTQDRLLHLIGSYGYQFLELPILFPTDLFLRKSGGELASQMLSFLDPSSNSISLRPEFTTPIMLHFLQHADDVDLPARWQYAGPVFRHEGSDRTSGGQFTQIGAELIGSSTVMADAELIGMAAEVLDEIGITGWEIRLADLQVLNDLLDTVNISDRARTFIIGCVPQLRDQSGDTDALLQRAQQLHLTGNNPQDHDLSVAVAGLNDAQAREVLRGFLHWSGGESAQLGQRDSEEVVERLLYKIRGSDDREGLECAFDLVSRLTRVQGEPEAAIAEARQVLDASGANLNTLERLSELVDLLGCYEGLVENLTLDFGTVRGIAYYNGITFQVTHQPSGTSLGGGGRYDALARALGSPEPVPALGFAYNLDLLVNLSESRPPDGNSQKFEPLNWPESVLVASEDPEGRQDALNRARKLRHEGKMVELAVENLLLPVARTYASRKGLGQVVIKQRDGQWSEHKIQPGR